MGCRAVQVLCALFNTGFGFDLFTFGFPSLFIFNADELYELYDWISEACMYCKSCCEFCGFR